MDNSPNRIRELAHQFNSKEEFLRVYLRNIAQRDAYAALARRMTNNLNQLRLGAIDMGWEIDDEDLGRRPEDTT